MNIAPSISNYVRKPVLYLAAAAMFVSACTSSGATPTPTTVLQPTREPVEAVEPTKTLRPAVIADPTFPVFVNTGNPEADNESYMIAKEEWIKNNPEKYEQLLQQNPMSKEASEERQ